MANIVTGFFGGMGGCAMIGQTMINVGAGARTRLSTFLAGVLLLILVVALGDVVALIPMAALVAVMIMVSVGTFDWRSARPATLRRMPRSETTVTLATVAVTVAALDAITTKYADRGTTVTIDGMNDHSRIRRTRLAGHLAGSHRVRGADPVREGREALSRASRGAAPRARRRAG